MILQKRRMGKLILGPLAACSTLVIGMYVYLAATDHPNHFWRKASTARITVNGQLELRARAYRHPDGKVLVQLGATSWYAYIPEWNNMYLCNPIRYVSFPGYIYAHDWDDHAFPCVGMGGVKTEVNADLMARPDSIEFTSFDHERIRVAW